MVCVQRRGQSDRGYHGLILLPNMDENLPFQFQSESTTGATGVSNDVTLPTFVIGRTVLFLFYLLLVEPWLAARVEKGDIFSALL